MIAEASPNIALIKYWGKEVSTCDATRNLPLNPSISMTLSQAMTRVEARAQSEQGVSLVWDNKTASVADLTKVVAHVQRVCAYLHVTFQAEIPTGFAINTSNNFPHGTGLASSASAFAALTLAIVGEVMGAEPAMQLLRTDMATLSALARRGSGSAARSLSGAFVKWEREHAENLNIAWPLRDTVVIFSRAPKAVSSTDAHSALPTSPLLRGRLASLPERTRAVEAALRARDLQMLGPLIETEALEIHRVVEACSPPIHYLLPETKKFLAHVQSIPKRNFFFTIDAGPNVHVLSEANVSDELQGILQKLGLHAELWQDECGAGPRLI